MERQRRSSAYQRSSLLPRQHSRPQELCGHGVYYALALLAGYERRAGIFYRGGAEQKIRKYLVENNFIDCIIQLPSNLFFGTSIATCIMVLKKSKTSNDVLFIDASAECVKVTNNNKLTDTNIENILRLFTERKDVEYTAKVVPNAAIGENDFNLSVSTYVEKQDTREKVDIKELNNQIAEIVAREQVLRDEIDKIIAEIEG